MSTSVEDKMEELILTIEKAMKLGNSPFTSPGTSGRDKPRQQSQPVYHKTLKTFSSIIEGAHGGVDDFTHSLTNAAAGFVELELAVKGFNAVLNIGKTFSKMTDIGENFNGSMFNMMQQAGQAGLSLNQFSALLSRNSMTTSAMGVKSMGLLQSSVRANLQQFGFYGMTLDDMTNTTTDYMETLRQTGTLFAFTGKQQETSVRGLIAQSSALAQAFGTNREEVIKNTNEIMRQTTLQAYLSTSTVAQTEAAQKMITTFAGEGNNLIAAMAGEQLGKSFVDTGLGNAFINTGMMKMNETLERSVLAPVRAGRDADPDAVLKMARTATDADIDRLRMLQQDPTAKADADQALAAILQVRASVQKYAIRDERTHEVMHDSQGRTIYDEAKFNKAMEDAKKQAAITDELTKDAMQFEDAFRRVTGQFMIGFYGAFKGIIGGGTGQDFEKTMESLGQKFNTLGTILGNVVVTILGFIGKLNTAISGIKDFFGFGTKDKDGKSTTSSPLSAIVAAVVGIMFAKSFLSHLVTNFAHGSLGVAGGAVSLGGKLLRRGAGKVPGLRWLGKAEGAVGSMLGDGCCDSLSKGLGDLKDRVDFHGDRAHEHATGLKSETSRVAGATEDVAEGMAETGGKGVAKAATEAATKATAKAGERTGLKLLGETLLKGSKNALKLLPGIGGAMAAGFAAQRAMQGDYSGALGEIAGGIASFVPVIGTAADAAIQAGLFVHDMNSDMNKKTDDADKKAGDTKPNDAKKTDATAPGDPAATGTPDNPCPVLPGGAYYHDGIATVDSTGSSSPAGPDPTAAATGKPATGSQAQLNQLNMLKGQLEAKQKADLDAHDPLGAAVDRNKLIKVLEDIRALTHQQVQLKKDGDDKVNQAFSDQMMYGGTAGGW